MKKLFLFAATLFFMNVAFAQQEAYDASLFSQVYYFSTARSAAMGGASGALGSDVAAIAVNPAAIVTYKTSELTFTPEFYRVQSTTNYYNQLHTHFKNDVNINNVGVVYAIQPKRSSTRYNFGFSYNKLNSFNANEFIQHEAVPIGQSYWGQMARKERAHDEKFVKEQSGSNLEDYTLFVNDTLPQGFYGTDINQSGTYSMVGQTGEYALSFGANVSEKMYLGASFIVRDARKSLITDLHEESNNNPKYRYSYGRKYEVSGLGFGGKLGLLILPVPEFSIGLSVQIPTFYSFTKRVEGKIRIPPEAASSENSDAETIISAYEKSDENYNLVTPVQLAFSLGYVISDVAVFTLDYEMVPHAMTKFYDTEGDASVIDKNNELLKEGKIGSAVRLGSEFYVWRGWIARLGGGYHTAASPWVNAGFNVGAGVGYNFGHALVDLSYAYHSRDYESTPIYTSSAPVKTTYVKQFIALSMSYRF
jgi:hypothetical protein